MGVSVSDRAGFKLLINLFQGLMILVYPRKIACKSFLNKILQKYGTRSLLCHQLEGIVREWPQFLIFNLTYLRQSS